MVTYEKPLAEYIDFAAEAIMDNAGSEGNFGTSEDAGIPPV